MESKDIIILVLGIMGSLIATVIINNIIKLDTITFLFALLIILAVSISIIVWILYKKIAESEEAISELRVEQKRANEKLKIHEQLIEIKKEIEILKENQNRIKK